MEDNIDRLISLIENQNKNLENLIEENNKLRNSPFDMTSIERLNELSEKVVKKLKIFDDSFESASNHFDGLFNDKKNLIEDIAKATEELKGKTGDDYTKSKECLDKLIESAGDYYSLSNREQNELNKRQVEGINILDDWGEKWEQKTKAIRRGSSEISKGAKQIYQSVTKTLEPWSKANHAAMQYAKTMGMSQKTTDAYLKTTVSWASKNNIGLLFNKTSEELIKMQGKYSEVLGRNVQLTSEQKKDMLAMEAIIGEDNMMDIANNLENFGMGMSDSAAFVKKTFDTATKSGIAASKLTKTIQENIKRAQNYTFKNGLDGLTSMAKKAIQLKTDMSLVDGFIDKTSTVEGAISTGANLQVLGGSYAMGSDPLSMLYDSLNNVEGMFDRAVGMAQGKVFYNDKTGNFEMGAMDRYIMKQAATQMGIDPSKMIDVAFRKASLDKIEGQVKTNKNISNDKEMVELVKNLATWDNGKAVVNIDGKDKAVSALTKDDKSKLEAMQRTDSQNLQEMAINLRSMNDIMSGVQKEKQNEQANIMKGIGEKITNYLKNSTGLLNVVSKIGAWGETIFGLGGLLGGIWTTTIGIYRTLIGSGNLFRNGSSKNTKKLKNGVKGKPSKGVFGVNQLARIKSNYGSAGLKKALATTGGKTALKRVAGGSGLVGAAVSLGTDMVTGDFKKDTGGSVGDAIGAGVGTAIGAAIGTAIAPGVGTWIGGIIGGAIGTGCSNGIQKWQKNIRTRFREEISNELVKTMPNAASLFEGSNALTGNYSKRQLKKIKNAVSDGTVNESELNGVLRKMRANNDLIKLRDAGINLNVALGNGGIITNYTNNRSNITSNNHTRYDNGGILHGKSHADGGMPILGSNIVVEGGEFVINKKATQLNLPLLEKINSGNFKMQAREPLGKQMKVNNKVLNDNSYSSKKSNLNIEPISINLSGTIKLDAGNRQFDISNEILNNPQLITRLTEMINKQINILDNGSYNKSNFKQKFN